MATTKRPTPSVCLIGQRVEIRPAFSAETGERSVWDEIAGCEAHITGVLSDGYVTVQIRNGGEVEVCLGRLALKEAC